MIVLGCARNVIPDHADVAVTRRRRFGARAGCQSLDRCVVAAGRRHPRGTRARGGRALLDELHPTEAEGYYLTLSSPQQVVFVLWRASEDSSPDDPPVFPVLATVSYNEAARFLDAGEHVDCVPMHPLIREWVVPFVAEHYRPEPRRKVRRNDPFAGDAPEPGRDDRRKKS